uniref:Uncharacterized protein n=1 Tax=Anguilla anguilla TaxID=7936 RepID=A0A0E9UAQ9_ANGAN
MVPLEEMCSLVRVSVRLLQRGNCCSGMYRLVKVTRPLGTCLSVGERTG